MVRPGRFDLGLCLLGPFGKHAQNSPELLSIPPAGCATLRRRDPGGLAVSRLDTTLGVVRTVFTARLAPVLLVVFAMVWPLVGFPWTTGGSSPTRYR